MKNKFYILIIAILLLISTEALTLAQYGVEEENSQNIPPERSYRPRIIEHTHRDILKRTPKNREEEKTIEKEPQNIEQNDQNIQKPQNSSEKVPKVFADEDYLGIEEKTTQEKDPITLLEENKPDLKAEISMNLDIDLIPITLEDAIRTALKNNYDLRIIGQTLETSKWDFYNTLTVFFPNADYTFDIAKLKGEFLVGGVQVFQTQDEIPIQSIFDFSWVIFNGLENIYTAKEFNATYKAAQNTYKFTKQETILNATTEYYEVLGSKLNIEVLTRNKLQREEQLKLNKRRFEAGLGTKFDVLRAEAEVAAAERQLLLAYNAFRLNQAQLANIMGIGVFTPIFPVEDEVKQFRLVDEEISLDDLGVIASENRPDYAAAKLEIEAARARKISAYSAYLPTITLSDQKARVGLAEADLRNNSTQRLNVDWSLLTGAGFFGYTDIKGRNAELEQSRLVATNTIRNIKQTLLSSYYDSLASKGRVVAAKEEVRAANESLRLAYIRLEAGVGLFIDVLQAQANAVIAKLNLINAIIDYNVAQVQMLFEMGIIAPSNVLNGEELKESPEFTESEVKRKTIDEEIEEIEKQDKGKVLEQERKIIDSLKKLKDSDEEFKKGEMELLKTPEFKMNKKINEMIKNEGGKEAKMTKENSSQKFEP